MKPAISLRALTLALAGTGLAMALVLGCVAADAGPLVPVKIAIAGDRALFRPQASIDPGGEGSHTFRVAPQVPGRLQRVVVQVGERVRAGQILGQVDTGGVSVRLVSPADGIVTSRDVAPGAAVRGGQTVVRILRIDSHWVRTGHQR